MKRLSVLGSTGSIGRQTLDIVRWHPEEFSVVALAANSNAKLLAEQVLEFKPMIVAIADESRFAELKEMLVAAGFTGEIVAGEEGVCACAAYSEVNLVVAGISGAAGLKPVLAGIAAGKDIAFANKEVLVAAGPLVMSEVKKHGVKLLPVDSEHSALWQCMDGHDGVESLLLTCSGGPFKYLSKEELVNVKAADALKHPTWTMGPKITIDSASLMNKGLEIIEAHFLFDVPYDKISAVIHPQSIIHSMVQYNDSAVLAHLGYPDMRVPIQYALTYPRRLAAPLKKLDFAELAQLTFIAPDMERFPCLKLAIGAGISGGAHPVALNAANEVLVHAFLRDEIGFMDIPAGVEKVLAKTDRLGDVLSLEEILAVDAEARSKAAELFGC